MAYEKISVSLPEEELKTFDAIREAMGDQSAYAAVPDRSSIFQEFVAEFNDEHGHLIDDDNGDPPSEESDAAEVDTGNPMPTPSD